MRDPAKVVRQIKAVVPVELKEALDWHITNALYKPPEQYPSCFALLSELCNDMLAGERPLVTDWKILMIEILTGKPLLDTTNEVPVNNFIIPLSETDVRTLYMAMGELSVTYGLTESEITLMERLRGLIQ